MNFPKPIAFFDLETTGTDVNKDRIVDISVTKIWNFTSKFERSETLSYLVNPGIPIPKEASDIHGITDEMVKDAPLFKNIGHLIHAFIQDCDLGGYNIRKFDIPLLAEELNRCGILLSVDGVNIFDQYLLYKLLHPRSLSAAYKRYVGKELEDAHRAAIDTSASIEVMRAMIEKGDVPAAGPDIIKFQQKGEEFDSFVDFAGKFLRNKEGVIILNLGKEKGKPAMEHLDFVSWMTEKDFTNDTLKWCHKLLDEGNFNRNKFDWNTPGK
jgi:DNA polymerase-3 subunit epsilon